ncbi:hypothetical protein K435DRAFT_718156 [Dendrothele bispora CBS 962.96]|uniref:Uncharacterized protein n=1 Tax=Dendrothele bispora (strain CBS 962.96) TaxID=1314807 RepID=A0A4S8MF68_DENBC|nr:hypothetical protein K435DRAFT_718156 [Dendrothele bispora CBS 962.96]
MLKRPSSLLRSAKTPPVLNPSRPDVSPKFSLLSSQQVRQNTTTGLGLRRNLPPDSTGPTSRPLPSSSNQSPEPKKPDHNGVTEEISDREWEVRTGRAIDILQNTLPHFFETGLIHSIDKTTGEPKSITSLPLPTIPLPTVNSIPGFQQSSEKKTRSETESQLESIYSPKVRLSYTPPVQLPAPFPKTLTVEGIPLYLASSVFIRHTLNALYTDLNVTLHKVVVRTPKSDQGSLPPSAESEDEGPRTGEEADRDRLGLSRKMNRDKNLFIGLRVVGTSRVSGAEGQWEVNSTYTFSPQSGLIYLHTINSIEPAPHLTVYDALRVSLGNVFGYGVPSAEGGSRVCSGKAEAEKQNDIAGGKVSG